MMPKRRNLLPADPLRAPRVALVTGAAGFLGSELVRRLAGEGWRVLALDNLATGRWERLAGVAGVDPVRGDVRDAGLMARLCREAGSVFHLACLDLRYSLQHPEETHDVNATGTLRVLEAARAAGVRRFVHVSSSEVYGTAVEAPMTESHPTNPTTPYGASKLAGEAYARAYWLTYGVPVVIVRPFNIFGPGCHWSGTSAEVIPRFLLAAAAGEPLAVFGDGEQTRDFTFVGDTARGIVLAEGCEAAVGRTINLGSGREISMLELARMIAPGGRIRHEAGRPGDVRRLLADSTLARDLLGFVPAVSLGEGLERLAEEGVCAWGR